MRSIEFLLSYIKLVFVACDLSCEDECSSAGPLGCDGDCADGYSWDSSTGCQGKYRVIVLLNDCFYTQ